MIQDVLQGKMTQGSSSTPDSSEGKNEQSNENNAGPGAGLV